MLVGNSMKATIVVEGIPGRREPYAKLEDGRTMPMGWNMGQTLKEGMTGTAKYESTPRAGLWRFTPDE